MRCWALKKYILVFLIAISIMLLAWNMSEPEPWVEAISDTYFNAKVFGDKYIAYMDFEVISADPMSAILCVEMIDDTNIRLEYLEGTDYSYVPETIELEWTQVFCDEPVMVVAKETYYNADGGVAYWHEYEYTTITPSSEVAESKPE